MDFVERNEAKEKAIKEFWENLAKKLGEAVANWKEHRPLLTWKYNPPAPPDQNVLSVSRVRPGSNVFIGLECRFDQDSGEVRARDGFEKDSPVVSLHRIVLSLERKASLRRSDGTAVDVDDAVDEILWSFLKRQK
jgi:hypothetical protein